MHRPQSLVNHPLLHQIRQNPQLRRLISGIHRQVGLLPVPQDPQALKLFLLPPDEMFGHLLTFGSDHGRLRTHQLLFRHHLVLDRKPVTIPARNKWCAKSHHRPAFEDDILKHHIERMAHVGIPVGKRRTIVKMEFRGPLAGF